MQRILNAPVSAHGLRETGSLLVQARDIVTPLHRNLLSGVALRLEHPNEIEPFPLGLVFQPIKAIHRPVTPDLNASMVGIQSLMEAVRDTLEVFGLSILKELHHIFMQLPLIPLQASHIVPALVDNSLSDLFLTAHGVNGHNTAFELQQLKQLGDGGDPHWTFPPFLPAPAPPDWHRLKRSPYEWPPCLNRGHRSGAP